ncbi:Xylose isomerase-like TIM barrel [Rubripirellula tenax]|uniref:Xylose isomerase-like TIM barrel n=1 Tax=Rubripirellula tenax TaxID=2528015 RepID=A0A5C6FLJ7_9BACT|nr:sugar phosphate isomerase/epimerase family protein [Rubripirellula tenax]TWU60674.1 Xylose isomerase-like TIM barrel [Rubripirellula tenax]
MNESSPAARRRFLQTIAFGAAGLCASPLGWSDDAVDSTAQPWLRKTLKVGMLGKQGTLAERFAKAKQAGFEGVELNVPGIDVDDAKAAAAATGIILDGTVGGYHWQQRHSDPDPKVRQTALSKLKQGIEETAAVGADTMLLVPAHGNDGTEAEVYERAMAAVREAIPVAEANGVSILIENVWNHFLYQHDGPSDQTADALASFIDAFDSPWVGVQFDIGNHWKYGNPADWIRTLDHRIKKLDIKGFSRAEDKFTKITEGDIDWPSVETALHDIGFTGWLAAEVAGGDLDRLREINDHMEESLHCSQSLSRVN